VSEVKQITIFYYITGNKTGLLTKTERQHQFIDKVRWLCDRSFVYLFVCLCAKYVTKLCTELCEICRI